MNCTVFIDSVINGPSEDEQVIRVFSEDLLQGSLYLFVNQALMDVSPSDKQAYLKAYNEYVGLEGPTHMTEEMKEDLDGFSLVYLEDEGERFNPQRFQVTLADICLKMVGKDNFYQLSPAELAVFDESDVSPFDSDNPYVRASLVLGRCLSCPLSDEIVAEIEKSTYTFAELNDTLFEQVGKWIDPEVKTVTFKMNGLQETVSFDEEDLESQLGIFVSNAEQ